MRCAITLLALAWLSSPAFGDDSPRVRLNGASAQAVSEAALATVRGGFASADGQLQVTFGVQRAVYVDGQLDRTEQVVQRGAGNVFSLGGAAAGGTTTSVVQNSLDGQTIRTVTTIDVQAASLRAYRGIDLQSTVSGAVTASLRR